MGPETGLGPYLLRWVLLVVVTVPFKTIMVAKIIVVKYIKLKEKEKKHSQEKGMEDVSARKSCRKSSKFISNSVSRDFVYFLMLLKLNFVPSLPPPRTNKNDHN